jgi:signal transduction histidine kinase
MRSRIIGLAVSASVLAIALFGVPLAVAVLEYALQAERQELARTADAIAITVAADVDDGEEIENVGRTDAVDVAVYDEDGGLLGGSGPSATPGEVTAALHGTVTSISAGGDLVVAVPVTHEDDVIGAVRAATPRTAVLSIVALVWAGMAALAALAVTTTWLVGRRAARRLAQPLEELAHTARRLGEGDFSVRAAPGGIAEIDAVGSALSDTAARLDNMLARERAFSGEASHQLRTPLAGLRLRLEAALEQPDFDPRPAISATLADADRLEDTIEELLALARGPYPTRAALDVSPLLADLAPRWRERLAPLARQLSVKLEKDTPAPLASPAALRQALTVLVDNATTHGAGTVSVQVRPITNAVAIDVSDQGAGLTEPDGEVFSRRTDRPNGHGIGLALARRLVEAEGGRLQLTSRVPPVFTLLLPLPGEAADALAAGGTVTPAQEPGRTMRS